MKLRDIVGATPFGCPPGVIIEGVLLTIFRAAEGGRPRGAAITGFTLSALSLEPSGRWPLGVFAVSGCFRYLWDLLSNRFEILRTPAASVAPFLAYI